MTSAEIRQSFLDFFRSKQHTIVPSSSLLPDAPNLLFTNAGMNQFVPIFLGQRQPDVSRWAGAVPGLDTRAADTQKCIRAGGKHNDLEDVGLDTYHHTFFEMLGNWSFGDYFKAEAIRWAWELITLVWEFPKERLYATVYQPGPGDPAAFDEEAHAEWTACFEAAGLDPRVHIRTGGKQDNFWMMGETGPCGPCSELHMDLSPAGDSRGAWVNQGRADCMEIWNLVFIQFNANPDGTFSPLPARHVDTGMGFERVAGIVQGTRRFQDFSGVISNYETDIFRPLFARLEELSGRRYGSTLPRPDRSGQVIPVTEQERVDVAFRVIADHLRTLSFGVADGIEPGNGERNYVLRRILRRAVRYGRALGFRDLFFHRLVPVLAETMGEAFPEVRARQEHIAKVLRREEMAFNDTLDRGLELFEEEIDVLTRLASQDSPADTRDSRLTSRLVLPAERGLGEEQLRQARRHNRWQQARSQCVSGEAVFVLHDTFGFPDDLTQLLARERGFGIDRAAYELFMAEQKRQSQEGRVAQVIELSQVSTREPTRFVGFDQLEAEARVLEVVRLQGQPAVVLDVSPCYAEMGGQVGDTADLVAGNRTWRVTNTRKAGTAWLHCLADEDPPSPGTSVQLRVDTARRAAIQRHHTVTHLLHWALHKVVAREATQKGSFVGPEKLTFDFNSEALTPRQVSEIERLVNECILDNAPVSWVEVEYRAVKDRSDVLQFFGDKYGDRVRVVQVGGRAAQLDGYSMELCGGTHCRATGEIGLFRVTSENAIAAGIRRIEAVAGWEAHRTVQAEAGLLRALAGRVKAPLTELERRIEGLLAQQKELERKLAATARQQAVATARELVSRARVVNGIPLIVASLGEAEGDVLQAILNELKGCYEGVAVLGGTAGSAVALAATVTSGFTARVQAGRILQTIAPMVGGKGGGRPDHARGGGKDTGELDRALARVEALLQ
jgi:alanyl-tRNA synthetase